MCVEFGAKSKHSFFKTSYQRAHYYENLQDLERFAEDKPIFRPELYYNDPIFKKKVSTYRHDYNVKKRKEKHLESYGKFNLTSRHTLKNLYDEYSCRPYTTILKYDSTLTGLHYKDPSRSIEAKLLENFCNESSNLAREIKQSSSEKSCYSEYTEPYTTTYDYFYEDHVDARKGGIAKDDVITFYNRREKNKRPVPKKIHSVKFKSFFTVPFNGDSSTYREDFKDPAIESPFLGKTCLFPNYFQTLKNEISEIPGANMTEQKMIGFGKPTRAIV